MAEGRPLRRRLVAILVLLTLVVGSGFVLQRSVGPKAEPAALPSSAATGAWFCPHGGGSGWSGWVALTNPGTSAVSVRLTSLGSGEAKVSTAVVPPMRLVMTSVPADEPGAATEVEYFGGWIAASTVVESHGDVHDAAATRCSGGTRRDWFLLDEPTGEDETGYVVVMNPFDQDAEFDVVLRTEKRRITPGELTPFVAPARSSVAVKVNSFALEAPGEPTVTAEVATRFGRVVAGSLAIAPTGVRGELGTAATTGTAVLATGGYSGTPLLELVNAQERRSDVSLLSQTKGRQKLVSKPEGEPVTAGASATLDVGGFEGGSLVVHPVNGVPVAAAAKVVGGEGASAAVGAVVAPVRRWLVSPACTPDGGKSFVVVENPGHDAIQVTIRLISATGATGSPISVSLQAGRSATVEVAAAGDDPVSAVVTSSGGTFAAAAASYPLGGSGFAATPGLPIPELG